MGKCIVCGKKGLFLKVNTQGMCNDCAEKARIELAKKEQLERTEFETHYNNLLSYLNNLQEIIDVGNDPIKALEFIPEFEKKLEICDILQKEIHNTKYKKRFESKLISSITYRDEFNERHGIGKLEEWGVSVFADSVSKKFSIEKILDNLDKLIYKYRFQWNKAIKSVRDSAEFQKTIDQIPYIELKLTNDSYDKRSVSELDELVKYTNITAKTSLDRIGSFVVIDTETTGLSSTKDTIIEIAAIKFEDWIPVAKFHTLLNPGKHIPEDATAINNITDDMVADSPMFSQIIDCLSSFVGKSSIVGHNLPFDLKFLYRYGYNFTKNKRHYYDTCEIAKKTLKISKMKWDKEYGEYVVNDNYDYDVENYKLTTLCEYYQIRDNSFAHRAMSDALATGILFQKLAQDKIVR